MEKIKLVRHVEELKTTADVRDGSIDYGEIKIVTDFYVPEILSDIESGVYDDITIISSNMIRSVQTAKVLSEEISKHTDIPIVCEIDERCAPQLHGEYRPNINLGNPISERAKSIYLIETFEKGNIWYRYGDSNNGLGEELYPELNDIFVEPGENQVELSIRTYGLCLDLLDKVRSNPRTLLILSTHYLTMSRLLALESLPGSKITIEPNSTRRPGDLCLIEWDETKELVKEFGYSEFFKKNHYIFNVDCAKVQKLEDLLESELEVLLYEWMLHYDK